MLNTILLILILMISITSFSVMSQILIFNNSSDDQEVELKDNFEDIIDEIDYL